MDLAVPVIHPSVFVAPTARVYGEVTIGPDAVLMIDVARIVGSNEIAETMFHGVRAGGHEIFRLSFSWGFGRE